METNNTLLKACSKLIVTILPYYIVFDVNVDSIKKYRMDVLRHFQQFDPTIEMKEIAYISLNRKKHPILDSEGDPIEVKDGKYKVEHPSYYGGNMRMGFGVVPFKVKTIEFFTTFNNDVCVIINKKIKSSDKESYALTKFSRSLGIKKKEFSLEKYRDYMMKTLEAAKIGEWFQTIVEELGLEIPPATPFSKKMDIIYTNLKYRPGGWGMEECQRDFEALREKM